MVCTPAIKSLEQRTEIKGKENRRVRRTGGSGGGCQGEKPANARWGETRRMLAHIRRLTLAKQGPETTLRELHPRNRGDMEPRNAMWPSVTPAACDVRACARPTGRPTNRLPAGSPGPSHLFTHRCWVPSRERLDSGNTVSWMHCHLIMDPPMLALA